MEEDRCTLFADLKSWNVFRSGSHIKNVIITFMKATHDFKIEPLRFGGHLGLQIRGS